MTDKLSLLAAAALIVTLGACEGGDNSSATARDSTSSEGPGEAIERIVGYLGDGQYRRAYEAIYPRQRELFSFEQYEACREAGLAADIAEVEVTETFEEPITPDGLDNEVSSTAVTAAITLSLSGEELTQTDTYHVIDNDGEWTFTASDVDAIVSESC